MLRRWLSLLAIGGCVTARPALDATHEAGAGKSGATSARSIPRPRFDVVPAELGDPDVLARLRARVIVRRWDRAYLRPDEPIGTIQDREETNDIVPVIDVDRMIRIVIEDDGARLAVWIARENTQFTVLEPTETERGVRFLPGAPLVLGEKSARERDVVFEDPAITVRATLPAERVGTVYVAPADDPPPTLGPPSLRDWQPPADHRSRVQVSQFTTIYAQPSRTSQVVARLRGEDVTATLVADRGGWREIELHRPFVRVRGFVEAERTLHDDGRLAVSSVGGHGFGVSHSISHVLPAGTCIYDRVNGDVIGTTLEARSRIGGSVADEWAMVYVDTPWGAQKLFIKDLGDDPAQPRWETCTEQPHHR